MRRLRAGWVLFGPDGRAITASREAELAMGAPLARWKCNPWPLITPTGSLAVPLRDPLRTIETQQPMHAIRGNHHGTWVAWVHNLYIPKPAGGGVLLLSEGLAPAGDPGRCGRCEFGVGRSVVCACDVRLCWTCAESHVCPATDPLVLPAAPEREPRA
jgi:hypothetical protein